MSIFSIKSHFGLTLGICEPPGHTK
uniref:Uncharacterized protein n=1 Tax=Anguilla anguilla TaxID=7936 RepID=A0A0E9TSN8_ANGAN